MASQYFLQPRKRWLGRFKMNETPPALIGKRGLFPVR